MTDEERKKVEEYIERYGVTPCLPMAARDMASAKAKQASAARAAQRPTASLTHNIAVIKLAIMLESLGGKPRAPGRGKRQKLINDARWFFFGDSDLDDWCIAADRDPDYVREKARKIAVEGLPEIRAIHGTGKEYEKRKAYRKRIGIQRMDE